MSLLADLTIAQPEPNLRPEELVARAAAMREHLREEQAVTEGRGTFSPETHEMFRSAGFYRTLLPRRFGGYEFDVATFVRMVVEVARGCPGSGWCLCLAAGHGLQISGLFNEKAQANALAPDGEFCAPMRGVPMGTATRVADGGWEITGVWDYCSGSPYATHALLGVHLVEDGAPAGEGLALVPRNRWILKDDWRQRAFGMRGSGSNSIEIEGAVVPEENIARGSLLQDDLETPGYELHGNPMYAGPPMGYLQLEVTAVLVGCAYAALDEYERIISTKTLPGPGALPRSTHPAFQRHWGVAAGKIRAAEEVLLGMSRHYQELCAEAVEDGVGFETEQLMSINASTHHAVNLAWEAVELLFRTSGTSEGGTNGSRMQRYYRDISTARTNAGLQYENFAERSAQVHFGLDVSPLG
ncbi:acyl-CoA dehydrogenase [Nocardioides gilvus]|uniref:acyl-CoA dehydrogenase n=1 Tax=Nocardioides gilvus TaxID=1735589 RepID=UPI000D747672|nr:acyl-CoA dehydrogenase [Nocardioides gilvus]